MSKSITVTATGSTKSQDSSLPGSLPVSAASTSSSQTFAEAISNKPNRLDFAAERRRIKDAHSLNSERKSEISVPPPIALPASADAFPERSFQEPVVSSSVREVFTPTSRRKPVVSSVSDSTIYWIDQHIARLQAQQHSAANGLSLSPTKSQPSSIIDLTDTPNVTAIDLFSAKSSDSNSTTASPLSFITTHSSSTVSTKTSLNASVQLQCSPPLKRLVQFYTTILAQRMTKSCISELSWLLRLLCIAGLLKENSEKIVIFC
jgi:hypothetical protein